MPIAKDDYKDLDGEWLQTEEEENDVVDTEDGGAMVKMDDDAPAESSEHFVNLAEELDAGEMAKIAEDLLEAIQRDKEARKRRDEQYEKGLRLSGMADEEGGGGADFEGSSLVSHPVITEACIDFAARAMKEVFPPSGPVKDLILGDVTSEKVEKAARKTRLMNRQATIEIRELRSELEALFSQLGMGGSQYLKVYRDRRRKRTAAEFVPIDDVLLPFSASSYETAERKTHVQRLTELGYKRKIKSKEYVDVDVAIPDLVQMTDTAAASAKIEGKEDDPFNIDGLRTVFEVCCFLDIEEEDDFLPYVVVIDESTRRILAIYRNWDEEDQEREELQHMVEFRFIPWRGAYAIGFPHIIGGLTTAITGSLRALMDSALINNIPTAIRTANGGGSGQTIHLKPGRIAEIEGSLNNPDIRANVMAIPFNPPSPVLFQLLGFLTEAARGVVRTTFEDLAEQKNDMPVGTTMALIEQGMTVFSAIHSRTHDSMRRVLEIMHRLNRYHLTETQQYDDAGEVLAKRSDFEGPTDVIPVSDPNIFSETQRMAQVQAIAGRAAATAEMGLYNLRKVEERILEQLKIPNAEELLAKMPEPQNLNAVNENVAATLGQPVTAFPDQDHLAHLTTHLDFIKSPVFGANPFIGKSAMPILVNHLREHIALLYISLVDEAASGLAGQDISKLMDPKSEEVMAEFDRLMANISPTVTNTMAQILGDVLPIIDQAAQAIQAMQQQQMPADPKAQAAHAETMRKTAADQAKVEVDQQKLGMDQAKLANDQAAEQGRQANAQQALEAKRAADERKAALDEREQALREREMAMNAQIADRERQSQEKIKSAEIATKVGTNREDNQTAIQLATMEIEDARDARSQAAGEADLDRAVGMHDKQADRDFEGEKIAVSTGTGINP